MKVVQHKKSFRTPGHWPGARNDLVRNAFVPKKRSTIKSNRGKTHLLGFCYCKFKTPSECEKFETLNFKIIWACPHVFHSLYNGDAERNGIWLTISLMLISGMSSTTFNRLWTSQTSISFSTLNELNETECIPCCFEHVIPRIYFICLCLNYVRKKSIILFHRMFCQEQYNVYD
jgi:hypothetical protein